MTKEGFIGQFVVDSTIRNSPSFHFGVKHKEKLSTAQLTPGPAAYFPDNKTYNTGEIIKRQILFTANKSWFKRFNLAFGIIINLEDEICNILN